MWVYLPDVVVWNVGLPTRCGSLECGSTYLVWEFGMWVYLPGVVVWNVGLPTRCGSLEYGSTYPMW